jgi:twitching motility protein PilT
MDIFDLLKYTVAHGASDLHLSCGIEPIVRIDGDLEKIPETMVLSQSVLLDMLDKVIPTEYKEVLSSALDMDLAVGLPGISRFRVNIFHQFRGISAAFRALPSTIPTFEELGFPEVFRELCELPHGLILVTGPTGSGKTTTMASMINYINKKYKAHVLTIEDPIEYVFEPDKCLIQQREVKRHTAGFSEALRAALREDPDYILVGEMRDLETIRLALTAAETGHLVFATLHTNSAAESIDRIIDAFPSSEKSMVRTILAGSLQAVLSQILVCRKTSGRIAAQEIMVCTNAIRNLIREDKVPQIYSTIQTSQERGMRTLAQHLKELEEQGVIEGGK